MSEEHCDRECQKGSRVILLPSVMYHFLVLMSECQNIELDELLLIFFYRVLCIELVFSFYFSL